MQVFESEEDLLSILDKLDSLVLECAAGNRSYEQFEAEYGYPFGYYALDGHESDDEERALLARHQYRIELHRRVADEILHLVCSPANAELESYRQAGRFGPREAQRRLQELAREFLPDALP